MKEVLYVLRNVWTYNWIMTIQEDLQSRLHVLSLEGSLKMSSGRHTNTMKKIKSRSRDFPRRALFWR